MWHRQLNSNVCLQYNMCVCIVCVWFAFFTLLFCFCFAQAIPSICFQSVQAMKCVTCGSNSPRNFRCKAVNGNEPFQWWCMACYDDKYNGTTREHEIQVDQPIKCIACNIMPACMRIKFQAADNCQEYWCYVCYEKNNTLEAHPHMIHDLNSDSESISSSVPSCDEEIPLAEDGQSDPEDARSLGSWCKADCQSVLSWDTTSNASFQLAWEKLDIDDAETTSNASFQMVEPQQQHQHEQ